MLWPAISAGPYSLIYAKLSNLAPRVVTTFANYNYT
jgi:hypothetical protein